MDQGESLRDRRACSASVRTSRVIRARPEELYAAFLDPTALVDCLPPAEITDEIRRMSALFLGNTSDREDMVNVRFLELTPPRSIVEAVSFVTTDPAFFGEMTMIATFEEASSHEEAATLPKSLQALRPARRPQLTGTGILFGLTAHIRRGAVLQMEQPTIWGVEECVMCALQRSVFLWRAR